MRSKLKSFLSQEAMSDQIDNNEISQVSILDEQHDQSEREAALAETQETINDVDMVEGLDEANNNWRDIAKKALDSGNITPELREGLEAHFTLMTHYLGPVVSTETFALEGVEDDTTYLLQATTSLEGLGGALGKIKNSLYDRLSKSFHAHDDLHAQQEVYTKLSKQATDLLVRLKQKYKDPSQKIVLKTGRYTNTLTQGGQLVTDLPKALELHLKAMHLLTNNYADAVCANFADIIGIYTKILNSKDANFIIREALELRSFYTSSEMLPKDFVTGKNFLGNMALKPNPKTYAFKNNDILKYIKDRGNCAAPHWSKAGPIPEAGKIEMTVKDLFLAVSTLVKITTGLKKNYSSYVSTEQKMLEHAKKMEKSLRAAYAFGDFGSRVASTIATALIREVASGVMPVQLGLSKEIPIIRGLLGFLGRA